MTNELTPVEGDAIELCGAIAVLAPRLEWKKLEALLIAKLQAAEDRGARRAIEKKQKPLPEWTTKSATHWQMIVNGKLLDFWPTTKRFRFDNGPTQRGDVHEFIRRQLSHG